MYAYIFLMCCVNEYDQRVITRSFITDKWLTESVLSTAWRVTWVTGFPAGQQSSDTTEMLFNVNALLFLSGARRAEEHLLLLFLSEPQAGKLDYIFFLVSHFALRSFYLLLFSLIATSSSLKIQCWYYCLGAFYCWHYAGFSIFVSWKIVFSYSGKELKLLRDKSNNAGVLHESQIQHFYSPIRREEQSSCSKHSINIPFLETTLRLVKTNCIIILGWHNCETVNISLIQYLPMSNSSGLFVLFWQHFSHLALNTSWSCLCKDVTV